MAPCDPLPLATPPPSPHPTPVLAHDRALSDWLEAEALVERLRRAVRAAEGRATERIRAADAMRRAGRRDPFALGVADAARVLEGRVRAAEGRLREALRMEAWLRGRVVRARGAVAVAKEPAP